MSGPQQFQTPERAEAARLRALYQATMDDLRNNSDLKPQVRDQQIKDMHAEGRSRLDKLRQADRQRLGAEHQAKQKELFNGLRKPWNGSASDVIAIRDAQDRAAQLRSPDEAAALMRRARDNGDRSLEAAVGKVASERNTDDSPGGKAWRGVLEQYVAAEPESREPLVARLGEIEDLTAPGGVLGDEFTLRQPPEARRVGFSETVGATAPSVQS